VAGRLDDLDAIQAIPPRLAGDPAQLQRLDTGQPERPLPRTALLAKPLVGVPGPDRDAQQTATVLVVPGGVEIDVR
jgi:hypothetical protein